MFPVGLILVLIGGGELLTGNMMAVPLAAITRKITPGSMLKNLLLVTLGNLLGALFVAFFFGHVLGLTADGVYLTKVVDMAGHKLHDSFFQAFISGIGCNWLVALAVWLSYAADTMSGKILGIWFPTMAFVAIGFQHVVANMFLIPAAIFEGHYTWGQYVMNFIPVWLGNLTGGALFVAAAYWIVYLRKTEPAVKSRRLLLLLLRSALWKLMQEACGASRLNKPAKHSRNETMHAARQSNMQVSKQMCKQQR